MITLFHTKISEKTIILIVLPIKIIKEILLVIAARDIINLS